MTSAASTNTHNCVLTQQIITYLIVFLIAPQHAMGQSVDATVRAIRNDESISHSTTLYLDCKHLENASSSVDQIRNSWSKSYEYVRSYFEGDQHLRNAFNIESVLTHGEFTTQVDVDGALKNLTHSAIVVTQESVPSYSYEGSTATIVVTTGLISHICDALLPTESFWTEEEQQLRKHPDARVMKQAEDKAHSLAAKFLISDVRYGGIKIFVLGHEASHLLLDRYSGDLTAGRGYQNNSGCGAAFFLETRADILGVGALQGVAIADKVSEPLRRHLSEFPSETVANMDTIAVRSGVTDLLNIIDKEKEWQPAADSCAPGAQQRRMELEHALANSAKRTKSK